MDSGPSLRTLQQWMKARVRPRSQAPTAMPSPLNPQGGVLGEERLAVYAQAYRARIRESLQSVYPAVHQVVGEEAFEALALAYSQAHPSVDYNLDRAGVALPEFLSTYRLTEKLPFLPDLARLEWRVIEAFHAHQEPPLIPSECAQFPLEAWAQMRFVFQPAVSVLASRWPIVDIWEARTQPRETIDIALDGRAQRVLVSRCGEQVRCQGLTPAHALFLETLLEGKPLAAACHAAQGCGGDQALAVDAWCADLVQQGQITHGTSSETTKAESRTANGQTGQWTGQSPNPAQD